MTPRPDAAGVLTHRLINQQPRQPAHRPRLPRLLPAAASNLLASTSGTQPAELASPRSTPRRSSAFLATLRQNAASVATRNARLVAIHSLVRLRRAPPSRTRRAIARVLAIPSNATTARSSASWSPTRPTRC